MIVLGYINFASDLDRTWNVQDGSMCVRTVSSFAMTAYIHIYTHTYIYMYQRVVDKLLDTVLGVSVCTLWGTPTDFSFYF